MTIYHGTNIDFDRVLLSASKDKRDFGKGFYTTTVEEQAVKWSVRMCNRYSTHDCFVYTYNLEIDNLKIKVFKNTDEEWLDFVLKNRKLGGIQHPYDIVQGPVADDNTMPVLELYFSGVYDTMETLRRLKAYKLKDQISLHTEKALTQLTFVGRKTWKV
jgi:hypothetical protein